MKDAGRIDMPGAGYSEMTVTFGTNGTHNSSAIEVDRTYDTVVVGGGAAGIGAAIGAKQACPKSSVLLVESEGCLGGAATHRGVLSYAGLYSVEAKPRRAVGRIWTELHDRLVEYGAASRHPDRIVAVVQNVDPEGLKIALDDLTAEYDIDVLLHATVVGAKRENGRVQNIEIQERRGRRRISGKSFVDCSGDGDLAYHAGASVRYGNHGSVNMGSLSTRFGGLSAAQPTSSLWRDAIIEAKRKDPSLIKKIPRNVGVLIVLPGSGDVVTYMASASYDATNSASISAAERQGRRQAQIYLDILRKLPGHGKMYLVSSGPNFGTRESRHINANYQLKEDDIVGARNFEDTVAIGAWYMEWHDSTKADWPILFTAPPCGTFDIPLGCLQSMDTENMFCAGRCVDGDRAASSAFRVMGTALVTGQAAGVASALIAEKNRPATAPEVRAVLELNGAFLDRSNLPSAPESVDVGKTNMTEQEALNGH